MNDRNRTPGKKANQQLSGSVMVVGGGIAGMQASMDLADLGYKVFLVEEKSAIGGHMAQLDKTFPTNDCAMCNISPKLVDTGRNINIEILTNTDVLNVNGQAGNFTVTLQHRPRYIDIEKCVGCGDCAEVCPVIITDMFEEGLKDGKAANRLYAQAVPSAYAIDKLGIAPCRDACPTGQRAQGYIALIREGRFQEALRVIKEDNPFPGICGRICNHRCEDACNRSLVDEPINIRALKRVVTDKVYSELRIPVEPAEILYSESIAIIGAGPCGLTAAQDLAKSGYNITIFEALSVAGGMLRVGVPEYRLPASIVDREVQDILDLGIDLRLDTFVENLNDIFDEGFNAVLIAVGAHEGIRLPIPGANLDGVLVNTVFLRDVRLDNPPVLGNNVAVIGAGDVAMDVARTARRLGSDVKLYYRRTREEATADKEEIFHAEEEGVDLNFQITPIEIIGDEDKKVIGMKCIRTEQGFLDDAGRRKPVPIPGSEHFVPCDTVIFSVGQRAGLAFIPESVGVGFTDWNTIAVNPNTMAATRSGVFAAGDATTGTSFVIEAVEAGHRAAQSIHRYLRGQELEFPPKPQLPVVHMSEKTIDELIKTGQVEVQRRVPMDTIPVTDRLNSFDEVVAGYTDEKAQEEAARCLSCGICSECLSCYYNCGVDAIDHDMLARIEDINVGAVVLAPGYRTYDAALSEEFGLGRYSNVLTSLQFERLLSASGPTMGHVKRPSDGKTPKKIAFLQCIGSRDQDHDYCSSVCCMYATKEALIAKEHDPNLVITIFMMDMRSFSKGYQSYFNRAKESYGILFNRCRPSSLDEDPITKNLYIKSFTKKPVSEDNIQSDKEISSSIVSEDYDMVVLSVGMEVSDSARDLGHRLGIDLDENGFCRTPQFNPVETSRPGIFAAGPFIQPKDIPESVIDASSTAASISELLTQARNSDTKERKYPPEKDIVNQPPRIGVFVCHCGSNIGGFLDVPYVSDYAGTLPFVVHSEDNLYTCSQDSIKLITDRIKEFDLNRVVVASCSPLTHAPLFQDSIRAAGLNPFVFEMANIRNQCSWVHSGDWEAATNKAKELVRMAVARVSLLEPQKVVEVPVQKSALVVGGGSAGMSAAISLAEQLFPVHLVEKEHELGGNLKNIFTNFGDPNTHPQEILTKLISKVRSNPFIKIYLCSEVSTSTGFIGNFKSIIKSNAGTQNEIDHGVTILATGAAEYHGDEYGYGSHPRIITQFELEKYFSTSPDNKNNIFTQEDAPSSVAMILCVGPAEKFCSRICCTVAIKNALAIKKTNPNTQITILYKDIRTYGFKERLYTQARESGVLFIRYNDDYKPDVKFENFSFKDIEQPLESNQRLTIAVQDLNLGRRIILNPDLLVLSMPIIPNSDTHDVSNFFKVPLDENGFFQEAHVKLRPVDFSTEGIFMAGMAHYPKFIDESMIQARAAASRAARVLSQDSLWAGGRVAVVNEALCTGCLTCVRVCPFSVPQIKPEIIGIGNIYGAAYIETSICQGCGSCAADCPAHAIQLMHYTDAQLSAEVNALIEPENLSVIAEELEEGE